MKRIALFVALALAIVFAAALININQASNRTVIDVHAIHNHGQDQHAQHQSKSQLKPPVVDGSATPSEIPDYAAQEIVLRILSSDVPDTIGDRKKAYLRSYGFDENAQAALMLAAREYKRLVEPIEKETDNIKNLNWPNPNSNVRAKLVDLQRLKEQHIAEVTSELDGRLQTYRSLDKWTNHFSNTVKRKIKGFASELPIKKIGFFRLFPDPFTAFAQAGGCDPTYVYTDTVYDNYSHLVYGYSGYSAGANNCGHEFNVSTQITHTGAPTVYGTDYAVLNIDFGSGFYDGNFFAQTTVQGFCPVITQTFPAGTNSDTETVEPFVEVKRLYASSDNVTPTTPVTLFAEIKTSETPNGGVTVQFGISSNPSPIVFTNPAFPRAINGNLANYTVTVDTTATPPSGATKKGPVVFYAGLAAVPSGTVVNGPAQNITVCFGPKVMGTCEIQ